MATLRCISCCPALCTPRPHTYTHLPLTPSPAPWPQPLRMLQGAQASVRLGRPGARPSAASAALQSTSVCKAKQQRGAPRTQPLLKGCAAPPAAKPASRLYGDAHADVQQPLPGRVRGCGVEGGRVRVSLRLAGCSWHQPLPQHTTRPSKAATPWSLRGTCKGQSGWAESEARSRAPAGGQGAALGVAPRP